jgi:hypothetical protein
MSDADLLLIDEVLSASGLSALFGRSVLVRALVRAGVDPEQMTAWDLERALPSIEQALRIYLKPSELKARMAELGAMAQAKPRR